MVNKIQNMLRYTPALIFDLITWNNRNVEGFELIPI